MGINLGPNKSFPPTISTRLIAILSVSPIKIIVSFDNVLMVPVNYYLPELSSCLNLGSAVAAAAEAQLTTICRFNLKLATRFVSLGTLMGLGNKIRRRRRWWFWLWLVSIIIAP